MNKIFFIFLISFSVSNISFSQDSLKNVSGDSIRITYSYINTDPQNAEVFLNDTLVGSTPYRQYMPFKLGDVIRLRYPGFLEEVINISEDESFLYKTIDLISLKTIVSRPRPSFVLDDTPVFFSKTRKPFPIAVSAIVMIASGILAYKFKQDANERYDNYLQTLNRDDLDLSRRLDVYSGISLGVSIVSLGTAMYYLFFY